MHRQDYRGTRCGAAAGRGRELGQRALRRPGVLRVARGSSLPVELQTASFLWAGSLQSHLTAYALPAQAAFYFQCARWRIPTVYIHTTEQAELRGADQAADRSAGGGQSQGGASIFVMRLLRAAQADGGRGRAERVAGRGAAAGLAGARHGRARGPGPAPAGQHARARHGARLPPPAAHAQGKLATAPCACAAPREHASVSRTAPHT